MHSHQTFQNLNENVIVISGCAGQIGSSLCNFFAKLGCRVVGLDILDITIKPSYCEENYKHKPIFIRTDITDTESVKNALQKTRELVGEPYGLIHAAALDTPPNASADQNGPLEELNIKNFKTVIDVNVTGTMIICQVFGEAMASLGKGSIAVIGSIYGEVAPRQDIYEYRRQRGENFYKPVAYSVSKSALSNMVRYLATYWAKDNVRANLVVLAGIYNNQDEEFLDAYLKNVPIGRMATVQDIYGTMALLMSDASSYITGSSITIDGGYTAL